MSASKLNLCGWRRYNRKFELDTKSNNFKIIKQDQDEYQFDGFASLEPILGGLKRLYAVYGYDQKVWFRADNDIWDITNRNIDCSVSFAYLNTVSYFSIFIDGEKMHAATLFHPVRAGMALIDPTYDYLELESDHFFVFLAGQLPKNSWQQWILDGCKADT